MNGISGDCAVFDARCCGLGEGALWHPLREELFWFDILGRRLLARGAAGAREWALPEMFSAAGWVDAEKLVLASETGLWQFSLRSGGLTKLCAIEAEWPETRSNDGRADPQGGFWIGTMGKAAEPGLGAIWRWHAGELRKLYAGLTIPNAICFSPDGGRVYFADTPTGMINTVALDAAGWPQGQPSPAMDFSAEGLAPDGAVTDAQGNLWIAQWGSARVACYTPTGRFLRSVSVPAPHCTCPAFGGAEFRQLFVTSALQGLQPEALTAAPLSGATFSFSLTGEVHGKAEPRVC